MDDLKVVRCWIIIHGMPELDKTYLSRQLLHPKTCRLLPWRRVLDWSPVQSRHWQYGSPGPSRYSAQIQNTRAYPKARNCLHTRVTVVLKKCSSSLFLTAGDFTPPSMCRHFILYSIKMGILFEWTTPQPLTNAILLVIFSIRSLSSCTSVGLLGIH